MLKKITVVLLGLLMLSISSAENTFAGDNKLKQLYRGFFIDGLMRFQGKNTI